MKLVTQLELVKIFETNQTDVSHALVRVKPMNGRARRPLAYDWDEAREAMARYGEKRAESYREKSETWQRRADAARQTKEPE